MVRIPILIDDGAAHALAVMAKSEYRDVRQQAAVIIRGELERRGLLPAVKSEPEQMEVITDGSEPIPSPQ